MHTSEQWAIEVDDGEGPPEIVTMGMVPALFCTPYDAERQRVVFAAHNPRAATRCVHVRVTLEVIG